MNKNIGIFSTHPFWPVHFDTDLELIQKNCDIGNKVFVFNCSGCINKCEAMWGEGILNEEERKIKYCNACKTKQDNGYNLINGEIEFHSIISEKEKSNSYLLDSYYTESIIQLKKCEVDNNYTVGWAMLSSLVSAYRDPFISIPKYSEELTLLYQDCCRIYYSAKEYIATHNLSEVYVFNGRFSYTKAILDAAKATNINCYVHERGGDTTLYSLYKNHTFHNISMFSKNVYEAWDNHTNTFERDKIANQFFIDRENNIIGSWSSFLDNQDPNMLPSNWDLTKHNIVFYTSSEDEFVSISPEWNNNLFVSQIEGIKQVCEIVSKEIGYHLYIRMHPNKKGMSEDYLNSFKALETYNYITLINYDSNISSYQLLKNCNKVITYGSTVTFEALYKNKPSILVGKNLYYNLKGPHIPINKEELEELVLNKNLTVPENDALKLGYYLKTFGYPFQYYKALNYKTGKFKGVNLNEAINPDWVKPPFLIRVKNKLKKLIFNN